MTNLHDAAHVKVGDIPATAVYMGATKVWPPAPTAQLIFFKWLHPYELQLQSQSSLHANTVYEGDVPESGITLLPARETWLLGQSSAASQYARINPLSGAAYNIYDETWWKITSKQALEQWAGHRLRLTVDGALHISRIEIVT
jgi:hypothetical protein